MGNLAYRNEEIRTELLNGQIVNMSPRPTVNHNRVTGNIYRIFGNFLTRKTCTVFVDGVDVFLTEKDRVIPDVMIVSNKDIVKKNGIYGSPDLMVEVLSPSTAKNDKGYKKQLYERCGIKEYWIVDPENRSIEVYWLKDGQYILKDVYSIFPDYLLEKMTEEEIGEIATEFQTSLFPDLTILLEDVFENLF